jgi:transposase
MSRQIFTHSRNPTTTDGVDGSRSRHRGAKVVVVINHEQEELSAMKINTVGLDLAKNIFQVHGIDDTGNMIVGRSLRRRQVIPFFGKLEPCLIGVEACGTSHYWARELEALGHEVKLMPPAYVKPYVKRGKTDAADAEAICEAVTRPTMRFVTIKSAEQQSVVALHRTRDLLVGQRTQLVNMIRSQLAEYGIVLAKGIHHALRLVDQLVEGVVPDIPSLACKIVIALAEQIRELEARIVMLEAEIKTWFRGSELAKRLETIPGIGFITASALAASVTDPHQFTSARQFAASLGLTPKADCSGGRERMGRISKMGDRYLRRLLVIGMTSQLQAAQRKPEAYPWVASLLAKKPKKLVAVAMANKAARITWVVMTRGEVYRARQPATEKTV